MQTVDLTMPEVLLQPINLKKVRTDCQVLAIVRPMPTVSPASLPHLELPPNLDREQGVLLYGQAPIWVYGRLVDRLRQFAWVACFDVRSNAAIVISSQITELEPGDILPITVREAPGVALLIVGPPNSGKSVLANTLRMTLDQQFSTYNHYLFRAHWDGEGNHTFETPNHSLAERLRAENKRKLQHQPDADMLIEKFFNDRAQDLANIRQVVDITLVDVGGKPDRAKLPVIQQCTHYWVISNDMGKVNEWHNLCQEANLQPSVVIESVLDDCLDVRQKQPYLELSIGPWQRGQIRELPAVLHEQLASICSLVRSQSPFC